MDWLQNVDVTIFSLHFFGQNFIFAETAVFIAEDIEKAQLIDSFVMRLFKEPLQTSSVYSEVSTQIM